MNVFGRKKDFGISDPRVSRQHSQIMTSSSARTALYRRISKTSNVIEILRDGLHVEDFDDGQMRELNNGDVISIKGGSLSFVVKIEDNGCSQAEPTLEEATQCTQADSYEDSPTHRAKRFKVTQKEQVQNSAMIPKRTLFTDADRRAKGSGILIMASELKFVRNIGAGSCGEVDEMIWRGSRVAVKRIFRALLKEDARREFEVESEMLRRLRHPQIVLLMGTCHGKNGEALIVTEYIERGSLSDVLRDSSVTLDWRIMLKMASDAAKGMNYLHTYSPPIIHRDLKSQNLLVDKDFNVKVTDFGLAKWNDGEDNSKTFCGTLPWTAPEVFDNLGYNEKVDVYSYGIVLWEIYTRQEVYGGMSKPNIIVGVTKENLRPPIGADCPVPYAQLMRDCWQKEYDMRPSFGEILHRLEQMKNLLFPSTNNQFKSDNPLSLSDTIMVNGMSSANLTQQFQRIAMNSMSNKSMSSDSMSLDSNSPASSKKNRANEEKTNGKDDILDGSLVFGDELLEETNYHLYKGTYRQKLANIKVFKDKNSEIQQKEDLEKEVDLLRKLESQRVAQLYGSSTNPKFAIVTERLSMGNLQEVLQSQSVLTQNQALKLCLECCLAVQVLHQKSIIHCSLKPFHFEVDKDFKTKVGGFGLSRSNGSSNLVIKMEDLKGSLHYSAPEIYRGEGLTAKSDVVSPIIYLSSATMLGGFSNKET
eukprot:TRINITY_DN2744_c0_g1_i3.p1 TRINITY_DN2744_c0_g1~~TRINITY_DN2744_c0_g1_i3.p1  ORF type:complete len:746 (+),score=216.81 TRINITY_DN2744_c0_g1_i3:138-2240(+)